MNVLEKWISQIILQVYFYNKLMIIGFCMKVNMIHLDFLLKAHGELAFFESVANDHIMSRLLANFHL